MKRFSIFSVMLVLLLAFASCDLIDAPKDNSGDNNQGGGNGGNTDTRGTFVLTDIPAAYNGKYAYLEADNWSTASLVGFQSINMSTVTVSLVRISNGRVSIPMWIFTDTDSVSRYYGSDTFINDRFVVFIHDTAILTEATFESEPLLARIDFYSVTFSNGSSTKSANDGYITIYPM